MKTDIRSIEDIQLMVDTFYGNIRQNNQLGPIFEEVIKENWQAHLEKMYRFWQTILLNEHTYSGTPFPPHMKLPVTKEHFEQWVRVFNHTLDGLFEGEVANEAKMRAGKMAEMFNYKIDYLRGRDSLLLE